MRLSPSLICVGALLCYKQHATIIGWRATLRRVFGRLRSDWNAFCSSRLSPQPQQQPQHGDAAKLPSTPQRAPVLPPQQPQQQAAANTPSPGGQAHDNNAAAAAETPRTAPADVRKLRRQLRGRGVQRGRPRVLAFNLPAAASMRTVRQHPRPRGKRSRSLPTDAHGWETASSSSRSWAGDSDADEAGGSSCSTSIWAAAAGGVSSDGGLGSGSDCDAGSSSDCAGCAALADELAARLDFVEAGIGLLSREPCPGSGGAGGSAGGGLRRGAAAATPPSAFGHQVVSGGEPGGPKRDAAADAPAAASRRQGAMPCGNMHCSSSEDEEGGRGGCGDPECRDSPGGSGGGCRAGAGPHILGKRKNPPSSPVPQPPADVQAPLPRHSVSHGDSVAHLAAATERNAAIRRIQAELQRFRCFSSIQGDPPDPGSTLVAGDGDPNPLEGPCSGDAANGMATAALAERGPQPAMPPCMAAACFKQKYSELFK